MISKPWDVVLLPFPFTDLTSKKRRPAIVISTETYNSGRDIVLMHLTSNVKSEPIIDDHVILCLPACPDNGRRNETA